MPEIMHIKSLALVITVPAYVIAPGDARLEASTTMTTK